MGRDFLVLEEEPKYIAPHRDAPTGHESHPGTNALRYTSSVLFKGRIVQPQQLQSYLYQHIPITQAMGVEVRECTDNKVVLFAPLAPNINHRDTVFGGSASTLAILSAWALLHVRLINEPVAYRLVIQQNTMQYEKPIGGDFYAVCEYDAPSQWERFKTMLARRGRARITVPAVLLYQDQSVASFEGRFVAVNPDG
jgi:thioesterase domain-containing protein